MYVTLFRMPSRPLTIQSGTCHYGLCYMSRINSSTWFSRNIQEMTINNSCFKALSSMWYDGKLYNCYDYLRMYITHRIVHRRD